MFAAVELIILSCGEQPCLFRKDATQRETLEMIGFPFHFKLFFLYEATKFLRWFM
ncbi:unnamed protein product [Chondrus crispus]|uniref:Uncharacterized protein n=1 Tax=Chondrus crispus TaxID=2769 RepID=R7QUB3_CHOCR|nr:unnamed protein product [Chondrus crispus]CDF41061.1 unnamed protein product [Chondrus crispus]|eukprot:XP_005711355.1 unnamed protein product [Chondrus crispus]